MQGILSAGVQKLALTAEDSVDLLCLCVSWIDEVRHLVLWQEEFWLPDVLGCFLNALLGWGLVCVCGDCPHNTPDPQALTRQQFVLKQTSAPFRTSQLTAVMIQVVNDPITHSH